MLNVVKVNTTKKVRKQQEKDSNAIKTYRKAKRATNAMFAAKVPEKWSVSDYKIILKLFKRPGSHPIPTLTKYLVALYHLWKDREPIDIDIGEVDVGGIGIGGIGVAGAVPNGNTKEDKESDSEIMRNLSELFQMNMRTNVL